MKSLNNHPVIIRPKTGLKANINAAATKALATEGELHWASDTAELFVFNGTENVRVPSLALAASVPWSGAFTNGDGDTVTVENGIIVGVV